MQRNRIQSKNKNSFSVKQVKLKIFSTCMIFGVGFLLISARAVRLHLTQDPKLRNLVVSQYNRKVTLAPRRGTIVDANGETLALDIKVDSVFAHPHLIEDKVAFSKELAKILNLSVEEVSQKINKPTKFVWIKRRISPEESESLKNFKFKGLDTLKENKRFYPNGMLASNLLGAVGYDAKALSGIELALDASLRTSDQPIFVETDARGKIFDSEALVASLKPKNIKLTIDKTIQYLAEKELQKAMDKSKAKGAIALVMEVQTGAILAMASYPTFDPNKYWEYPQNNWRNKNITDTYEPGSIFKIITAAAGLELLNMNKNSKMNCEGGALQVGKNVIHDHGKYGMMTLAEVIKKSSNICSYKIAQKVGKEKFYEYIKEFGFGKATGINIPGEVGGILNSLNRISDMQIGTIAFGQGISVTPLQLVTAYSAIANGGKLMKPYIVKEITDHQGVVVQKNEPQVVRELLTPKQSRELVEMLEGVVEPGGTGTMAKVDSYKVGGKTGTAQKVIEGQKGYAKNKYIASFVGVAPTNDPKIVILISVDEPKGEYYGGLVSAPVFGSVAQQTLAYLGVPPSMEVKVASNKKTNAPVESKKDKTNKAKEKISVEVAEGFGVDGGETTEVQDKLASKSTNMIIVPDLNGLSLREAQRMVETNAFKAKFVGTGMLVKQEPQAGTEVQVGTEFVLNFEPI